MLTELHEVAAARVEEESIKLSFAKIFAGRNVNVVMDTIEDIDFAQKTLTGAAGTYAYDILVIAAGSKPTFFGVKGADANAYKLWSYDDAVNAQGAYPALLPRGVPRNGRREAREAPAVLHRGRGLYRHGNGGRTCRMDSRALPPV